MATKDNRLKRRARYIALWRGHDMSRFQRVVTERREYDAKCVRCGMETRVCAWPMPNDIEVSGEAVALNCTNPRV